MQRGLIQVNSRLPYNPKLTDRAKELRKNMTKEEKKLWYNFLSKTDYRFLRQRPIDNYIVDFYCAEYRLVIEIDGSHHYTEDGFKYDSVRSEILSGYDIKVIRFTNQDINNNFNGVCQRINDELPLSFAAAKDIPLR